LRELSQRIQNRQRFTVTAKQKATRTDLERILDQAEAEGRPFHVIHFMGHGKTDGLLFEPDPDKGDDGWIPAENFAETVARKNIIMVTLSACESAPGVNFLESTTRELLAKGVPVVIGMQVPILDRVTVEFFREFYSAWAGGQIPEKAVATARRLTPTKIPAAEADWGIPTIYVGTEEELIVRPEAKVPPAIRLPIWILQTGWKWVLGLVTILTVVGTLLSSPDLINQVRMAIEPLRCNYPVKMDGDFNVAISPFIVVDEQGRNVDNKLGKDIAEDIYTYIEPSIKNDFSTKDNLSIRFRGPKQTCTTTTATAESIAKDMNANILIYGVIHTGNGLPKLDYEFEVSTLGYGQNPEITGEYAFGSQFPFYENVPILANSEITQQSIILTTIVKGLFFYSLGQYGEALVHFDEVIENPHLSEGKKIAYLLRGNAQQLLSSCNMDPGYLSGAYDSYQLSLDEDPDYLRGLIGLGGTEYLQSFDHTEALPGGCPTPGSYEGLVDMVKLDDALETYTSALQIAENEPDFSTQKGIEAKIYMGLGTIYLTKYFISGEENWLIEAQDAYNRAIEIGKNDDVAKFHVGQAYAMLATMNHCENRIDQAIPQYEEAARRLSPAESAGYYATLGELYCWKNDLEAAVQAYENAVANCGIASREECSASLNDCDEYNSTWRKLRLQLENGNDSCER